MKLTDTQQNKKTALTDRASKAHNYLTDAIQTYNGALSEAYGDLKIALDKYEDERAALETEIANLANDLRERFDAKSEKWQESEVGQAAATFVETWEESASALETFEVDEPTEIDEPESIDDLIDALPEESDE